MQAVRTTLAYLHQTKHYCISAQTYEADMGIQSMRNRTDQDTEEWSFHADSDHAEKTNVDH